MSKTKLLAPYSVYVIGSDITYAFVTIIIPYIYLADDIFLLFVGNCLPCKHIMGRVAGNMYRKVFDLLIYSIYHITVTPNNA